jgi:hypothetical protein
MNNFEREFLGANDFERKTGLYWYVDGHNYLKEMSKHFNVPLDIVCGMVAVTSPLLAWSVNVNLVYNILKFKGKVSHIKTPCFSRNLTKALMIYKKRKVYPYLSGPKVEQFYLNLLNPMDDQSITIDSFMISCWLNSQEKSDISKWSKADKIDILKQEIRILAEKYNLLPLQFQAIVWISYHRTIKSLTSYASQLRLKIF